MTHLSEQIERMARAICIANTDRTDDDFMTYYAPLGIAALDAMAEIQAEEIRKAVEAEREACAQAVEAEREAED